VSGPPTPLYADAPVPVRDDLVDAHRATAAAWARPGAWWSAADRLAIVAEVRRRLRDSSSGDELPPWVAPSTVDGLIDRDHPLPAPAIDAVWRLAVHPGTLTRDWYDRIVGPPPAGGLAPEAYVELVSLVATATCLEVFARALGVDPVPLPAPAEGRPSRRRLPEAVPSTHWVPTVPGRGANVTRALSAVPEAVELFRRLSDAQYVPADALLGDLAWSRGALDRSQVELLAARTSQLSECFY
jgi:hypothetical protein